jgi:hypothetical protein
MVEYVICTAQSFWSDPEAKLLMDKFREYKLEVGPMKTFKNKKSMWEKISADILSELGSLKTGAQCENRLVSNCCFEFTSPSHYFKRFFFFTLKIQNSQETKRMG